MHAHGFTGSRITIRMTGAVVAAVVAMLGSFMVAPSASAATLECGQASIGDRNARYFTLLHSCVGSGTVQYKVDCRGGKDLQFSIAFKAPGKSIYRRMHCGTGYPLGVTWDIK